MFLTSVEIKDAILMGLSSLRTNKLRTGLTILGVMIGVSSVIALASVIDGLNMAVEQEIDNLGSNVIDIDRFPPNTDYDKLTEEERNRPYMGVGEATAIRDNCPSVDGVAPQNHYQGMEGGTIKYKDKKFTNARFPWYLAGLHESQGSGVEFGSFSYRGRYPNQSYGLRAGGRHCRRPV